MKELSKHTVLEDQDTIELVAQDQHKKETRLISSQRKIPGHTLWEFNKESRSLEKATYGKSDVILSPSSLRRKPDQTLELAKPLQMNYKVNQNPDCIYFQALNRKNAIKVLKRDLGIVIPE